MKNNFFRKDLNLSSSWWHRLFFSIFFVLLIWVLYVTYNDLFSANHPYIPQWKIVNSVNERITAEVKQIRELKKSNERVEERDRSYAVNLQIDDSLYDDIYCSNDFENRIDDVQNKSGISTLYIRDMYDRNNVPIETFTNYIKDNNIKCLIPDAYTYSDNMKVRFLEPIGPNSFFYKDLVFYEKSDFFTVLYVLKMFLLVIAVFAVIVVVYYKIILYIIFGSKKIDNNKDSQKL